MGKWAVYSQGKDEDIRYHIHKHGDPAGLLTMRGDFDEAIAQRYKTALNVADAGVDLREAVEKLKLMHTITAQCGTYGVAHTYASWVEDFLRSIANAVEGTTKEDDNG